MCGMHCARCRKEAGYTSTNTIHTGICLRNKKTWLNRIRLPDRRSAPDQSGRPRCRQRFSTDGILFCGRHGFRCRLSQEQQHPAGHCRPLPDRFYKQPVR